MSSGRYVLGSDIGTSGCKSIVLDVNGHIQGWAIADYPTTHPHPGWDEQAPEAWFQAFCSTVQQALAQAEIAPEDIVMVCIIGVTHNAVLLDENDRPLRPSIVYTDIRSQAQAEALQEQWGNTVFARTQNQLGPLWTWPQLRWLRENEPDMWPRIRRVMFPKDYVRHRIAPSFVTDTIDAGGTLLYDPVENIWVEEFCHDLALPLDTLPPAVSPWQVVSEISEVGAAATGLAPGTPVIAGTTDTAAEVFGVGAVRPGQATVKLATMGRIAAISRGPIPEPIFLNYPHVLDGLWYPGTSTKFGAAAFTWGRQAFWDRDGQRCDYKLMDAAAATVPPGAAGLLFHPYLAGEFAPAWDPYLRASFLGVGLQHRQAHFTRAVMEGVGFAIRHALESILAKGLKVDEIRLIGGGARSDLWAQIMADILQHEVRVPEGADAAFGAALMAGVAAGMFAAEPDLVNRLIHMRAHFSPEITRRKMYDELFTLYKKAAQAITEISHELHHFQTEYE